MYSPSAIEIAPATRPAVPVSTIARGRHTAAADAGDERDVGDQPVHRAEDGGPQPAAGDVAVVVLDAARRGPRHGSVRISYPVSVTATMCSNWAVHLRSLVTTVQPSAHMSCR